MKLGDIYKHKQNNSIIQIDSFASPMGDITKEFVIVFRHIEKHNEFESGFCPSFNGYGSVEEIEKEYELFVPQSELDKYSDWNDIFQLVDSHSKSTPEVDSHSKATPEVVETEDEDNSDIIDITKIGIGKYQIGTATVEYADRCIYNPFDDEYCAGWIVKTEHGKFLISNKKDAITLAISKQ